MSFQIMNEAILPFILIGLSAMAVVGAVVITREYLKNKVKERRKQAKAIKVLFKDAKVVHVGVLDSNNNYLGSEMFSADSVSEEIREGQKIYIG